MKRQYSDEHAEAGVRAELPEIETWPNQYDTGYEIEIAMPEFTSICPKTGLPDHGTLILRYVPDRRCLELKSLKMYTLAFRNLGIFQENVVNRVLQDVVKAARPVSATVVGEFAARGGIPSKITAKYSRGGRASARARLQPRFRKVTLQHRSSIGTEVPRGLKSALPKRHNDER